MNPNLCHSIHDVTTDLPNLDWADPFFETAATDSWSRYDSAGLDLIDQHKFLDTSIDDNILSQVGDLRSDAPGYHRMMEDDDHDNDDAAIASATITATAIRELASLTVALYEHAANIPSLPNAGTGSADNTSGGARSSRRAALFAIDETFHLTKKFIDTVKSLCHAECNKRTKITPSSSENTLNAHHSMLTLPSNTCSQQFDHVGPSLAGTSSRTSCTFLSHADEATILMVLSCYCRLTNIYMSIFQTMQACINCPKLPMTAKDHVVVLPHLQVGSYTPPPIRADSKSSISSSTRSMYMLMFTMLSSQLYDQLADVMRAGVCSDEDDTGLSQNRPQGSGGEGTPRSQQGTRREDEAVGHLEVPSSSHSSSFTDKVRNTVKSRTDGLSQTIDTTRRMLQRFSVGSG